MAIHHNCRNFIKNATGLAVGVTAPHFFSTPKTLADETKSKNDRLRWPSRDFAREDKLRKAEWGRGKAVRWMRGTGFSNHWGCDS